MGVGAVHGLRDLQAPDKGWVQGGTGGVYPTRPLQTVRAAARFSLISAARRGLWYLGSLLRRATQARETRPPMRFFNTEGPNRPADHYCLPPLQRWDLDEVLALIDRKEYFLLHAPRQTGKTTCMLALMEHLNRTGRYRALYANIEGAQTAREDVPRGMAAICSVLGRSARLYLQDLGLAQWYRDGGAEVPAEDRLVQLLEHWAAADPRPAVLLLDEVDALVGDTLIIIPATDPGGCPSRPGGRSYADTESSLRPPAHRRSRL